MSKGKSAIPSHLDRARRGTFYAALSEKPARVKVTPQLTSSGARVFTALHGRTYEGPNISENDFINPEAEQKIKAKTFRTPVYMDGQGNIYCIDYILIEEYEPNPQQAMENRLYCPSADVFHNFPEPSNFESYSEYNQNLSQWYSKMQMAMGKIFLPNVTSRRYFRPRADLFDHTESEHDKSDTGGSAKNSSPTPMRVMEDEVDDDMEITVSQDFDPWECTLVPPEPEPELYTTFEAYEQAMKRWAVLCNKSMRIVPPHPSQLSALILLRTAAERRNAERERTAQLRKMRPMAGGSDKIEGPEVKSPSFSVFTQDPMDVFITRKQPDLDLSFSKSEFERTFDENEEKVLSKVHHEFDKVSGAYSKAQGIRTYIPSSRSKFSLVPEASSVVEGLVPNSSFPLGYANAGLKPSQELYCRPSMISPLDRKALKEDSEYQRKVMLLLHAMANEPRFDTFYSWHPNSNAHMRTPSGDKWRFGPKEPVDSMYQLVLRDEYLDEFQELMSYSKPVSVVDKFAPLIRCDVLPNLVALRNNIQSPLAQAKLAYTVGAYLQTKHAEEPFMELVEEYDCISLGHIAHLLNHFSAVPVDIYPIFPSTLDLVYQILPSYEVLNLVKVMICSYYLKIIQSVTSQPFFSAIDKFVNNGAIMSETNIGTMMQNQMSFMMVHLVKFLAHRSKVITQLFCVLLSHLFSFSPSGSVIEILSREEIGIVENIRMMCSSKISHVRFSGKLLLSKLGHGSSQQAALLRDYYKEAPQSVVDDLFASVSDGTQASYLSDFILEFTTKEFISMADKGLSAAGVSRFSYLMRGGREESIYHSVFCRIREAKNLLSPVYLNAAKFLVHLLKTYHALEIIDGYETEEAAQQSMSQGRNLNIVPSDINDIMNFLDHPQKEPIVYEIKQNLLRCAGILSKHSLVFDALCRQKHFHVSLIRYCRDGESYKFNKEAWRFFFHALRNNHGFLQHMENAGKQLNQLLELISPGVGNIVTTNCLNYICKILRLCDKEAQKIQETGKNSRGDEDIKLIERDVKQFVSVLVKHCLKVHLILKRLQFNNLDGAPFLSVANFYYQVWLFKSKEKINGSKLYKELIKNKDYKQLVSSVVKMFAANPAEMKMSLNILSGTLSRSRVSTTVDRPNPFRSSMI